MKTLFMPIVTLGFIFVITPAVEAMTVTSLDFTSGAVNWEGRYRRALDRLFGEDGRITMGSYQAMTDIVDPVTRGSKVFSLFTSGLSGAPVPLATLNGTSISVDLSSLFFGWTRGNELRAWNIGGVATGSFNPESSQFFLSWEHVFNVANKHNPGDHVATFFLQGTAVAGPPTVVPIPASLVLYGSGLLGLGAWMWLRRRLRES